LICVVLFVLYIQESQFASNGDDLYELENVDDDDDNTNKTKEDIGIMDTYVAEGISTNESKHQQRKTALLAHAKLADKGIILETALQSSDMP
jgi:hypothetical protein